ncbi:hypothetical protein Pve01_68720 [Planomonospora venezuelensis]|nr:hypothetical protein Pve01_68720 [Planomonospora venezuelensis]
MHVACTRYLTLMHIGGRSADAIDGGRVLPGCTGIIVRDGCGGYAHLSEEAIPPGRERPGLLTGQR